MSVPPGSDGIRDWEGYDSHGQQRTGWDAFQGGSPVPAVASRDRPLNALAVASFVLSLVLLAPLALVFGIVALVQIGRTRQRGQGLAIAGVTLSVVALGVALAVLSGVLTFRVWRIDESLAVSTVDTLQTGDCFDLESGIPGQEGALKDNRVTLRQCDEPHLGEVYATFSLTGTEYPGSTEMGRSVREGCAARVADYTIDPDRLGTAATYHFYPQAERWANGDRTVRCWLASPGGKLEASARVDESMVSGPQLDFLKALAPVNQAQGTVPTPDDVRDAPQAARDWAERMARASRESAAMLEATRPPAPARSPLKRFAASLRESARYWDKAAESQKATEFNGLVAEVRRRIDSAALDATRAALGLPVPPDRQLGA